MGLLKIITVTGFSSGNPHRPPLTLVLQFNGSRRDRLSIPRLKIPGMWRIPGGLDVSGVGTS